mgnify:CR=1 FL=1
MNRWQEYYIKKYHNGKMPRTKKGKRNIQILEKIKSKVTVNFPDFYGEYGFVPAHKETFVVTETDCNIPEGRISVTALLINLPLWVSMECKITTK